MSCDMGHHMGGVICYWFILCGSQTCDHPCDSGVTHSEKASGKKEAWEFPNLVVSKLVVCNIYAEALSCALFLRSFADLRLRSFALFLRMTAFRTTAFGNCREAYTTTT